MRRTKPSLTALLSVVFLFGSCGGGASPSSSPSPSSAERGGGQAPGGGDLLARADSLLAAGEFQQAAELLSGAEPGNAPSLQVASRLARALWGQGEIPKAERVCKTTLARHPQASELSRILAEVYLALSQYTKAVEVLREARNHGAPDSEISLMLGVCLGRLEDLEGAGLEFERAARAGAPRADVDYNMAVLLHQQGHPAEAEQHLRSALGDDALHLEARRELARVLLCATPVDAERLEEAVTHLNGVLDAVPEDWRANELLGDVYMLYDDPEAALAFYTEALRHGRSPLHVEEKYRAAAVARNELLSEQGLLEEPVNRRKGGPPLPDSLRRRRDQIGEDGAREGAEAGSAEGGGPVSGASGESAGS